MSLYKCEGCGAFLGQGEVEVYGDGLCHVVPHQISEEDFEPEPCGPVHQIDLDIEDLVLALNQVGLITAFSCQGDDEKSAYVSFDIKQINNFQIIVDPGKVTLYWDRHNQDDESGESVMERLRRG